MRKHLIPISNTVDRVLDGLILYRGSYYRELSAALFKMFRISIRRDDWPQPLPPHLQMRFTLLDHEGVELFSSRDISDLTSRLTAPDQSPADYRPCLRPEDEKLLSTLQQQVVRSWNFDSVPKEIPLYSRSGKTSGYLFAAISNSVRSRVSLSFILTQGGGGFHRLRRYSLPSPANFQRAPTSCSGNTAKSPAPVPPPIGSNRHVEAPG